MRETLFIILFFSFNLSFSQTGIIEKISVTQDTNKFTFVKTPGLFSENWDTLAQPAFWRQIMLLSPDSCLLNVAKQDRFYTRSH